MNALNKALHDAIAAEGSITGQLAAATSVFQDEAPENEPGPYVIYGRQTDTPSYTLAARAYEDFIYQVRAVTIGPGSKKAQDLADAIDALLSDGTISIAGHDLMVLRKISGINMVERTGGVRYNHAGALYRIEVTP